jgi:hypothetical protein
MDIGLLMCLLTCLLEHGGLGTIIIGLIVADRAVIWIKRGPKDLFGSIFVMLYKAIYYSVVGIKNIFTKK